MKKILNILIIYFFFSCNNVKKKEEKNIESIAIETKNSKIKVLNFATFHLGFTNDARSIKFDENNKKNVDSIHQIAKMLSTFNPTIIIVETTPNYNLTLQKNYSTYLKEPSTIFEEPDEVELLAFEIGRLANVKQIYGIDHKLEYNYGIGSEIINSIDSMTHANFSQIRFIQSQT